MNVQFVSFVQKVTALSPGLGAVHQETLNYWEETLNYWARDSLPLTVALGELGRRVVDDFNSVGHE